MKLSYGRGRGRQRFLVSRDTHPTGQSHSSTRTWSSQVNQTIKPLRKLEGIDELCRPIIRSTPYLHGSSSQVIQTIKRVSKLEGIDELCKPIIGCHSELRAPAGPQTNGTHASDSNSFGESSSGSSSSGSSSNVGSGNFGYRNKMQFAFRSRCWEPSAQGEALLSHTFIHLQGKK